MYSLAKSSCSRGRSQARFLGILAGGNNAEALHRTRRRRPYRGNGGEFWSLRSPQHEMRTDLSFPTTATNRFMSTSHFRQPPQQRHRRLQNDSFPIRQAHSMIYPRKFFQQPQHPLPRRHNDATQRRRMMARSSVHADSQDPSLDPEAKAMTFLVGTLGHEQDVARGVLDALKQSGVSGGPALLSMVRTLAGRWEVDEDAGLEALVESVTVELARSKGKETVGIWILPASAWASKEDDDPSEVKDDFKRAFKVEGFEDMSLTDVAKFGDGEGADVLGEMIECSCSGIMACSTCHVVVHSDWFEKVGKPTEAEEDMIDLAYNSQETSRLGCQIILKPNLQNAIFKIPRGANNMMDFIPFEDE